MSSQYNFVRAKKNLKFQASKLTKNSMSVKRIILIFVILNTLISFNNNIFSQTPYRIKKVVIDPGHGGKDPGTIGKHYKEKDVALAISLKLGKMITDNFPNVEVIYTRKTDEYPELFKRAQIANDAKADLFISIHCNANPNPKPFGTETYVMGHTKSAANLRMAQRENSVILNETDYQKNYNNFDPNSPESYIIFSLFQSVYRDQSLDFAAKVQSHFKTKLNRFDRGVKEAGFLVLWQTTMPSVLIEVGFLSNIEEEKYLGSIEGQDQLANGIFKAFKAYKSDMEKDDSKLKEDSLMSSNKPIIKDIKVQVDTIKESKAISSDTNEIIFAVQFTMSSTKKPSNSESFNGVNDVWSYFHDGYYKYVSGKEATLELAVERMQAVRAKGFKEAFVVAFKNGQRISPTEAVKLLNQQKQLQNK